MQPCNEQLSNSKKNWAVTFVRTCSRLAENRRRSRRMTETPSIMPNALAPFVWLSERPFWEKNFLIQPIMTDFNTAARSWDNNNIHALRSEAIAKNLLARISVQPEMKALEFGAGTGILSLSLIHISEPT